MVVTKDAMLQKTHYGIGIYTHVLRLYYPDQVVLALSGRTCRPASNPFNNNKTTLLVSIVNGCATHTDSDKAIPDGNAFNFAALHYRLEGQELLSRLNDDMHLQIGEQKKYYHLPENLTIAPIPKAAPKLPPPVFSYFKAPVTNVIPSAQVSLVDVYHKISGNAFAACTKALRGIADAKDARRFKAQQFDYVTFSGTFSKRNDAQLLCHSGLMAVDFDHLPDVDSVRQALMQDACFDTEMIFTSPSGDGLKWIIAIDISIVSHADYFRAVANYIKHTYGWVIDPSGKDVSRACFLPSDPQVFIHPKYL